VRCYALIIVSGVISFWLNLLNIVLSRHKFLFCHDTQSIFFMMLLLMTGRQNIPQFLP
jgi:hypothetical protein